MAKIKFSWNARDTNCNPTGNSPAKPHGKDKAGNPARLPAGISPLKPRSAGAGGLLPASKACVIREAGPGRDVVKMTSYCAKNSPNASRIKLRMRMAFR